MVLSRNTGKGAIADTSIFNFHDSTEKNVEKFFFAYESVTGQEKDEEEKAANLRKYLQGSAFDFYYNIFAKMTACLKRLRITATLVRLLKKTLLHNRSLKMTSVVQYLQNLTLQTS